MLRALSRASRNDPALAHKVSGASLLLSGAYSVMAVAHAQYSCIDSEHSSGDDYLLTHHESRRHHAPGGYYDSTNVKKPFRFATKAELMAEYEVESEVEAELTDDVATVSLSPAEEYLRQVRALCEVYDRLPTYAAMMAREDRSITNASGSVEATLSLRSERLHQKLLSVLRQPGDDSQLSKVAAVLDSTTRPICVKTFNILISRLTRLRHDAAAWATFRCMIRLGYSPDQYTIASVLNLCIATGAKAEFEKVVATMRARRKHLRRSSAAAAATDADDHGRGVVVFGCLIKGCVKFGQMRRAETYVKLMRGEGHDVGREVLTCLLDGYTTGLTTSRPIHAAQRHVSALFDIAERHLSSSTIDSGAHEDAKRQRPWDERSFAALLKYAEKSGQHALKVDVERFGARMGLYPSRPTEGGVTHRNANSTTACSRTTNTSRCNIPKTKSHPISRSVRATRIGAISAIS